MTAEEKAELGKKITAVEEQAKALADNLKRFEGIGIAEYQSNCRARYQENGNWARHYSTVRMSVSTFLIPVSLGVASFRWQPPAPPPISLLALSGVVWCSAVVLFVLFTRLTYQEMESARKKREKLADGVSAANGSTLHPRSDIASYLLALLTITYGALMIHLGNVECWHFAPWTTIVHAKTHSIACAMPALTIVTGLLAFLFTVGQTKLK
jgi:hypothetical protein